VKISDPRAPVYSTHGSRDGFSHWTTSPHLPRKKKLGGSKKPPVLSRDGSRPYGSFSDQQELERLVERHANASVEPANSGQSLFDRLSLKAKQSFETGKCIFTNDAQKHKKEIPPGPWHGARRRLRNARRGLKTGAQRLSHRIKQFITPLQMLQFVATLFLNVAHGLSSVAATRDTSGSFGKFLWVLGKAAAFVSTGERWMEPFGSSRKDSACDEKETKKDCRVGSRLRRRKERVDVNACDSESNSADRAGSISPAAIKEGLKNAKRWSAGFVGGVRSLGFRGLEGFGGTEDSRRERARLVEYHVKEGCRLNGVCDSEGAVEQFRLAAELTPNDPDVLVCLSKSLSDRVVHPDVFHNTALARTLSKEAAAISARAIAINPAHADARVSLGAALGRLCMWSDNREKVELSRAIKTECEACLKLDPRNDLAMHVLGRYEHQMATLGRIVRLTVRAVYGSSLSPGTTRNAEAAFRAAIAINPKRLIHRVVLGKLLLDVNRKAEALVELSLSIHLPREDINSEHERVDAVALLKKHWGVVALVPVFVDPPVTPAPRLKQKRSFEQTRSPRRSVDAGERPTPSSARFHGDSARGSPVTRANSGSDTPRDSARGSPG
jgi:hypothetical protein